ncbi:MAG: RIO1 family regulatory kinase/ATPase [Actinomycetota bacterium]
MLEPHVLEPFYEEGFITEILRPLSGGKEATIHLCRAGEFSPGHEVVVLKAYRPREQRDFRNSQTYTAGRLVRGRPGRAIAGKTRFGRTLDDALWQDHEWQTLRALHGAGVAVPAPVVAFGSAILMEHIGDPEGSAPQLKDLRPDQETAQDLFTQTMREIERMLFHNVVHADLSPFNLLVWEGRVRVIDLPQAVDPRFNPNAWDLLARDLRNVCTWFAGHGVDTDAETLAADLRTGFELAELVPPDLDF